MTNDTTTRGAQYDAHLCVIEIQAWRGCVPSWQRSGNWLPYRAMVYVRGYLHITGGCKSPYTAMLAGRKLAAKVAAEARM